MEREGKERIHFTAYTSRCIPPRHRATCSVRRFLNAGKEKNLRCCTPSMHRLRHRLRLSVARRCERIWHSNRDINRQSDPSMAPHEPRSTRQERIKNASEIGAVCII